MSDVPSQPAPTTTSAATPKTEVVEPGVGASIMLDSLTKNKSTVLEVINAFGEQVSHARTAKMRVSQQISWLVFLFLALIIVATGVLVYVGKMSDGSFTFLLGVMVGYLMQFADKILFKPEEQ
jgi:hypothetical protein